MDTKVDVVPTGIQLSSISLRYKRTVRSSVPGTPPPKKAKQNKIKVDAVLKAAEALPKSAQIADINAWLSKLEKILDKVKALLDSINTKLDFIHTYSALGDSSASMPTSAPPHPIPGIYLNLTNIPSTLSVASFSVIFDFLKSQA